VSRYAITDIHGCIETFNALLDQIDLRPTDELYLLGDYVDRGPDSVGVIDRIMELQDGGYFVKCLKGNHEEMALDQFQRNAHLRHGYSDQHIRWMMGLENYFEIPGYLLVHAGFNFENINPLDDTHAMRWIRWWESDVDLNWLGDRRIVYGHTPRSYVEIKQEVAQLSEQKIACIDGGCAFQARGLGYLAALDLDQDVLHLMRRIDLV
jgi:serine/threonine protein phosphatase 1